jgi:hypothetical protein
MKTSIFASALLLATTLSHAAPLDAPQAVSIGDSWTFQRVATGAATVQTRTIFKITGQGPDNQYVFKSLGGSVNGIVPTLWREGGSVDMNTCMIDFFGGGTLGIINSCGTSFQPGMDWNTEQVENNVRTTQRYEVGETEEISVPAGNFKAIKIEAHWEVAKVLNPGKTPVKTGPAQRYHFRYWYAPETKTMVKSIREFRNAGGTVTSRTTDELQTFRLIRPR